MVHRRSSDPKIYPPLILSLSLPSTVRRTRSRSKGRRNQGRRSCRRCSRRNYRRSCRCSRSYSNSSRSCCLDVVASPLRIFFFFSILDFIQLLSLCSTLHIFYLSSNLFFSIRPVIPPLDPSSFSSVFITISF